MIDIGDISDANDVDHKSSHSTLSTTDVNVGGGVEMLMNHTSLRPKKNSGGESDNGGVMRDVDAEVDRMISASNDGSDTEIDDNAVSFTDTIDMDDSGLNSFAASGRKRARTDVRDSVNADVDMLGADGYGRMSDMPPPSESNRESSINRDMGDDEDDESRMDPRTLHRKKLYYIEKIRDCERVRSLGRCTITKLLPIK